MKIQVEAEIFDDPEYCENESDGFAGSESCEYIDSSEAAYTCKVPSWYSGELEHDKNGRLKKCPQCKESYQKQKSRTNERSRAVNQILACMPAQTALLNGYISKEEYSKIKLIQG